MKNKIKIFAVSLLICVATLITTNVQADAPPPPPPDHGETGNVPGGGAPIGSGLVILLSLGAGYGAKKFYDYRKNKEE
jgi:hypothetical protein